MSDAEEVWRRKTDDEVRAAVHKLDDYTKDGRRIILAECDRRRLGVSGAPPSDVDSQQVEESEDGDQSPVMSRYQDGYRVANFVVWVGSAIKWLGLVLGSLVIFVVVREVGSAWTLQAVGAGALIAANFFVLGVLVSAQGQVLRAHLDTAVHSSPFLSDAERAAVMSLTLRDVRATNR